MIDREHGMQVLSCDGSSDTEIHFETFQDALDFHKENGWKAVLCGGGIWRNFCPVCH